MIRVFIAGDHALLRDGLRRILSDHREVAVLGESATGDDLLLRAKAEVWDVLLLDLCLPGLSDFDGLRRLHVAQPALRIIVLGMHNEDHHALRILRAGAAGVLGKGRSASTLLEAIRTVHTGRRYVTPELADLMLDRSKPGTSEEPHALLSRREMEVLVHIARGKGTSEIAGMLELSASTVSTHLNHIKVKLGRSSIAELAQYALVVGLVAR